MPGRRQAIIWTNAGILLIGTLGTNFSEILSEIHIFSFKKICLKTLSAKWWPFCLNELTNMDMDMDYFRLVIQPGPLWNPTAEEKKTVTDFSNSHKTTSCV